jgi:hypothetical protein
MSRDLQQPVGQTVPWYVYDGIDTQVDPVYGVGSYTSGGGRKWYPPRYLAVLSAVKLEGGEVTNDRGFYVVDTLHLVFSVRAARNAGLSDLVFNPDQHDVDRVIYEDKVFEVGQLKVRGMLTADYTTVGVDLRQVKSEELVNDPNFSIYLSEKDPLQ